MEQRNLWSYITHRRFSSYSFDVLEGNIHVFYEMAQTPNNKINNGESVSSEFLLDLISLMVPATTNTFQTQFSKISAIINAAVTYFSERDKKRYFFRGISKPDLHDQQEVYSLNNLFTP